MNANAKELYDDLMAGRVKFDMRDWCGSTKCIGGEAQVRMLNRGEYPARLPDEDIIDHDHRGRKAIAKWLGLDLDTTHLLFFPSSADFERPSDGSDPWYFGRFEGTGNPYTATQKEAAEALKRATEIKKGKR